MEKIYLDYNATTPLDSTVYEKILESLKIHWANPSSTYNSGEIANKAIENARKQIGDMINCESQEIIFTSGGTESNFMVINSIAEQFNKPTIITSNIEHPSIENPLKKLEKDGRINVIFAPVCKYGFVEPQTIKDLLTPEVKLVTIMLANNETGIIQPISEIAQVLEDYQKEHNLKDKILFHTDAAQAIGKIPVDVKKLRVDYLTIVGHKFYGPRIGAIFFNKNYPLKPIFLGGGQERNYRSGTENTAMIVGLGQAALIVKENVFGFYNHLLEVRDYFEKLLLESDFKININGKNDFSERIPNTCNFSFIGKESTGLNILFQCPQVETGLGAACHVQTREISSVSQVLLNSHIPEEIARNAMRVSMGRSTTKSEVKKVADLFFEAVKQLELLLEEDSEPESVPFPKEEKEEKEEKERKKEKKKKKEKRRSKKGIKANKE
ncbi:selenocysteine lyase [Anaeramoeba ignava]|uniref:Selenocysteine lyase n=1 Tax=Anaeramoeba ignava TaxID=1746090 RepID=A0A9Q0L9H5_ANAIG|nr:selenocysteine lyase [Anaeramoeba ignava]